MKVLVILLTYNHESFIAEAIAGVLKQRANFDYELLILDDFSTDRTREIIADFRRERGQSGLSGGA